jgi:glycosyltransferase involved in cell wall biosynthesis
MAADSGTDTAAVNRMAALKTQQLSILCPVHNEELTIPLFYGRIRPVLERLAESYTVHLVFLDNASTDRSAEQIEKIRESWPATYVIAMSRNVGYHASLECGLRNATGDLFVFIDVDCEDPPEMVLEFMEKYEQGFDIAYGERVDRHESRAMKSARKFFYRLLHALADEEILLDMAEFSLFTREVRDAILDESRIPPRGHSFQARQAYCRRYSLQPDSDVRLCRRRNFVFLDTVSPASHLSSATVAPQFAPVGDRVCVKPISLVRSCRVRGLCGLCGRHRGLHGTLCRADL